MTQPPRKMQFSIRLVLVGVTLCAVAVAVWKSYIWVSPTDRILSYEKAPHYHGRTARIGPNQIRIESVARNDRDGTIRVETGRGEMLSVKVPYEQILKDCSPWMDVAQIELSPGGDLLDVLELRIFDHERRELIGTNEASFGWRAVSSQVLQVYGIGKKLPDRLDVWMRLNSYDAKDSVYRLSPTVGSSVQLGSTSLTVSVKDLQRGFAGWSSTDGFFDVVGDIHAESAFEFDWQLPEGSPDMQLCAVTKKGERFGRDRFVRQGNQVVSFPTPVASIDHFEIRRFGGRHRFFFDGVELPESKSALPFADPPVSRVNVGGAEVEATASEFLPLDVRVTVPDGDYGSGSTAGATKMTLIPHPNGPENKGGAISLIVDMRGFGARPTVFRFQTAGGSQWKPGSLIGHTGGARSFGAIRSLSEDNFRTPLSEVDAIEISIGK